MVDTLDAEFKARMSEYYSLASGMNGTANDKTIMRDANKLRNQAKALLKKIVELTKKEMDANGGGPGRHAPHIGEAAPHSKQQERLRPIDKGKAIEAWRLELAPYTARANFGVLLILPINSPVSDAEYNSMVTVLMYANASKEKTSAAAVGDLASISRMKTIVREKMQTLPAGGQFPASLLEQIRTDIQAEFVARSNSSVARATAAVAAEQKGVGDARVRARKPLRLLARLRARRTLSSVRSLTFSQNASRR